MNKKELLRTLKYIAIAASAGVIQFVSFTLMNKIKTTAYHDYTGHHGVKGL